MTSAAMRGIIPHYIPRNSISDFNIEPIEPIGPIYTTRVQLAINGSLSTCIFGYRTKRHSNNGRIVRNADDEYLSTST